MTKKFDTIYSKLLQYVEMTDVSVYGPASAEPYNTSDTRNPVVLAPIRKRKKSNKCGCK